MREIIGRSRRRKGNDRILQRVFGDWKNSTGTCEEIRFAKANGIKIRYIEGDK